MALSYLKHFSWYENAAAAAANLGITFASGIASNTTTYYNSTQE